MSANIYVSDASPIILLSKVNQLQLLQLLFKKIYIPERVHYEVTTGSTGKYNPSLAGAREVTTAGWIEQKQVTDTALVHSLMPKLDQGEAEAIALAKEMGAELLVIDENKGRKQAKQHGITITGTLGILTFAKEKALIDKVRPPILKLISLQGKDSFRCSADLIQQTLEKNGEWFATRDSLAELKSCMLSGRQYTR